MDDKETASSTRHVSKATAINVDSFSVELSPAVRRGLARIEAAVEGSKDFDPDIRTNLQEFASGKPFGSIRNAFSGIATITQQTMRHISATGDKRASRALDDFISTFYLEEERGTPAFTLVPRRGKGR